ncbi:MAG: 4-hydroxybenzoate polyprenyltransferase [Myxococcota bacterium]|jgi:4-hydroxybenzoate polyprenyltransferase
MTTAPEPVPITPNPMAIFLSVSRFHIVAIAALGTFTFHWLFTGEYSWSLPVICAVDWFVVNLLNRVVDLDEDRINRVVGVTFVQRHHRALTWLGFSVLGTSLVATHALYPEITWLRLAYHALGLTYNWRLLPGGRRIKELYFFKNTASALGFMLTVFCYPLATVGWGVDASQLAPGITMATILVSAAFFTLFELSYEVIYDLRDAPGDAVAGVKTYPVVHGLDGAMKITDALIAVSSLTLLIGYASGVVPWRIFVMILAPALNYFVYKRAMARGITSADCVNLTWLGAGLLTAYHFWVFVGLPGVGI